MNRNHSLCIVAIRCFIRTILWRQTMFGFWLPRLSSWCRIRRIKTVYLCLHQTHNNTRNIIFLIILENGVIYFNATLWRAINKNWPLADCLPLTQQTNYILFLCFSFYVLCVELKRSHFGCVYFGEIHKIRRKINTLLCCVVVLNGVRIERTTIGPYLSTETHTKHTVSFFWLSHFVNTVIVIISRLNMPLEMNVSVNGHSPIAYVHLSRSYLCGQTIMMRLFCCSVGQRLSSTGPSNRLLLCCLDLNIQIQIWIAIKMMWLLLL